jgi:hypothetical protein
MRRITLWITATLAGTALMFAYQANATGTADKRGENKGAAAGLSPGGGSGSRSAGPGSP